MKLIPFCWVLSVGIIFLFVSCKSQKSFDAFEIEDGLYTSRIFEGKKETVFLDNEPQFLHVFPVNESNGIYFLDTIGKERLSFPQSQGAVKLKNEVFQTKNFDLDLISIPFKFRSRRQGVPPQLNTNLNASLYVGYRSDWYTLGYKQNEFGLFDRITRHYGMTFGFFSGLGSTSINPLVTQDRISYEYDGITWSNGIALSFAFNYLNLGIGFGWDKLLDNNSRYWVYQNRPWLGLVLGINLN